MRSFISAGAVAGAMVLVMAPSPVWAGTIVGGSSLLTGTSLTQLESWLGEGELTLTNVFTKQSGNTAGNFHAAVDGKGRTFSVMEATDDGITAVIGGYNPQSWNASLGGYYTSMSPSAFIFNLSFGTKYTQIDIYQTANTPSDGPTFGGGHDIFVSNDLSSGYSSTTTYRYNFWDENNLSIVSRENFNGQNMTIGNLEVFTISSFVSEVPEPASLSLLCIAMAGVFCFRRPALVGGLASAGQLGSGPINRLRRRVGL